MNDSYKRCPRMPGSRNLSTNCKEVKIWGTQDPGILWVSLLTDSMDMSLSELGSWRWTGRPGVLRFMGSQRVGHD